MLKIRHHNGQSYLFTDPNGSPQILYTVNTTTTTTTTTTGPSPPEINHLNSILNENLISIDGVALTYI
jgi:hypothetical protein